MLKVKGITKTYTKNGSSFTALDDVSLNVVKGEFVAIVGPSGSGKSTFLHTVGGLIRPDAGQIFYKGKDIYALNNREANRYRGKSVGFVFQQFHLMPYLTVYENVKMADTETADNKTADKKTAIKKDIEGFLKKCSLLPLRNKYPSELSVGEKQRTAFVRAIISKPEILLADEPTGNLDPENSRILMSLIADFHKNGGTVLLVTHQSETSKYASREITLHSGKIL